jgi:hypothetical protein
LALRRRRHYSKKPSADDELAFSCTVKVLSVEAGEEA